MTKCPHDLAHELIGTTDDDPAELDAYTQVELEAFDEIAFRCEGCGWWCSMEECNEAGQWAQCCDDCYHQEGEP